MRAQVVERLCRDGFAEVLVYDILQDGRIGHRTLALGGSALLVAEGIFAQEVIADTRMRGILDDATCVRTRYRWAALRCFLTRPTAVCRP